LHHVIDLFVADAGFQDNDHFSNRYRDTVLTRFGRCADSHAEAVDSNLRVTALRRSPAPPIARLFRPMPCSPSALARPVRALRARQRTYSRPQAWRWDAR